MNNPSDSNTSAKDQQTQEKNQTSGDSGDRDYGLKITEADDFTRPVIWSHLLLKRGTVRTNIPLSIGSLLSWRWSINQEIEDRLATGEIEYDETIEVKTNGVEIPIEGQMFRYDGPALKEFRGKKSLFAWITPKNPAECAFTDDYTGQVFVIPCVEPVSDRAKADDLIDEPKLPPNIRVAYHRLALAIRRVERHLLEMENSGKRGKRDGDKSIA